MSEQRRNGLNPEIIDDYSGRYIERFAEEVATFYFSDLSSTQAARSYFTRRRCASPMRKHRRITSCSADSSFCATFVISAFNSSLIRNVFITSNFFSSFIQTISKQKDYISTLKK